MRANSFSISRRSAVASHPAPGATATGKTQSATQHIWATITILALLYGMNVFTLMRLDTGAMYPYYLPDEAEYALVGQNLLTLHAFQYHGLFPLLIPPLYPIIVAIGRLLSANSLSTFPVSLLNHLIMEAVIFPAYALARRLQIARLPAILIALVVAWTPFMWEASHYLAEVLYYPLFVTSCVTILTYFQRPSLARALLTGATLSLALLTKNTGAALVLAWGLANLSMLLMNVVNDKPSAWNFLRSASFRSYLLWPALSVGVIALLYGPWLILRSASLQSCAACAGETSVVAQAIEHPGVLAHFLPFYLVDLFLRRGVLALPLALLGWRSLFRSSSRLSAQRAQTLFIGLIIVVVILMAATYSGYTMGEVRERHLFVLTPLLLALIIRGLESMRSQPRWKLALGATLIGLAQVAIFLQMGFSSVDFLDTPWIYGLGFWMTDIRDVEATMAWDAHSFILGLIIVVLASQLLWLVKPSSRATVLLGASFIMAIAMFVPGLAALSAMNTYNRTVPYGGSGVFSQWLIAHIGPNQTLAFVGCDPLSLCATQPSVLKTDAVTYGFGINYWELYYAEVAGMYNMIPVPEIQALPSVVASAHAAYLLSPVALTGLPEMGHFGIIRLYDLRAYRANPHAAPTVAFAPALGCYAENLRATSPPPTSARSGAALTLSIQVRNISACVWSANGQERILLAYRWRTPAGAVIGSFISPPVALPHDLAPGQTVELTIPVVAPPTAGAAVLELDLATFQGAGAFEEEGGTPLHLPMTITG